MNLIEELKKEHQAIILLLEILESICQKLEKGQKVDIRNLEEIVDFIRTFADKCHHGKEESLLFPELEKSGMSKEMGPIAVMLTEHKIGRDFVGGLDHALSKFKSGDDNSISEIIKNARGYAKLLSEHIDKENNILYPMAEEVLSADQEKNLEIGFAKVEEEIVGRGKHEEYHRLLAKLKEIYLN